MSIYQHTIKGGSNMKQNKQVWRNNFNRPYIILAVYTENKQTIDTMLVYLEIRDVSSMFNGKTHPVLKIFKKPFDTH